MTLNNPLETDHFYHVYNRGNNRENLFRDRGDYQRFLQGFMERGANVLDIFAYCLLPNHFHFLVRVRTEQERQNALRQEILDLEPKLIAASNCLRGFFISYAAYFNAKWSRTGSLFRKPFRRKVVDNAAYFINLVCYIHRNPQTHGLVDDFRDWPWSSYHIPLSDAPTQLSRDKVLDWFNGRQPYQDAHQTPVDDVATLAIVEDDW